MNINIDGIKNYLQASYQYALQQGGKLGGYTIEILKQGLEHIRRDACLAGLTIAATNILIVEIAQRITSVADRCLGVFGADEDLSEGAMLIKSVTVLSIFSSIIVGSNIALYKGLKAPLSPMAAGAISTATCLGYITLRFCQANKIVHVKGSEE